MHVKSLLHVRDHSKATGPAGHMLEYIAQFTNQYTGEAFELTVDRIAHRLQVSTQWVGQLRRQLLASGELIVKQSRGRRPNVYVIPYERCHLCQQDHPTADFGGDECNPKVEFGVDDPNPKRTPNEPQSNPKVTEASRPEPARISPQKDVKEERENNVNVEINQLNPKRPSPLTLRQEDLVEELVRRFRDEHSRATYRRIVGALGEDLAYRVMLLTWEVRDRIAVSLGAYFVGVSKQVAKEQGIDLGFGPGVHPAHR